MNGLDPQGSEGPYFNAPQQQQLPTSQSAKRKGEEESPPGGGQRVCILLIIMSVPNTCEEPLIDVFWLC